ncbi:hypothetical protein RN001_004241 [Aquatica leii]|uniref:Uncharacterized protein n=1 Tax=Aquatica leii TaxID=1421715 RepID=A0AAN7SHC6_9COLE|nr:hypothetical protein RN001_004241 [Aquatica leii]
MSKHLSQKELEYYVNHLSDLDSDNVDESDGDAFDDDNDNFCPDNPDLSESDHEEVASEVSDIQSASDMDDLPQQDSDVIRDLPAIWTLSESKEVSGELRGSYSECSESAELVVANPKLDVIPQQRVPLDAPILTTAVVDVERTRTDTNNTQIIIKYLERIIRKQNILQSTIVDINHKLDDLEKRRNVESDKENVV